MKIKQLLNSFRYAARGLAFVFRHEQNFRIQLFVAVCVISLMLFFRVRKAEMIVIFLLLLLVFILELLNSALERFVDIVKPRLHYQVEVVKDIMAAMVLLASLGAVVIGMVIFWPYFAYW